MITGLSLAAPRPRTLGFASMSTTAAREPWDAMPAVASAGAVLAAGIIALLALDSGPVARHMATHIALMNVLAPLAAILVLRHMSRQSLSTRALWAAAVLQIMLLWATHAPPLHHAAVAPVLLALLLVSALAFWVLVLGRREVWQSILALLMTGKLACLLGVLLIFAPRTLYPAASLPDQQLAGLLMVTACPLSYLVAGVALFSRGIADRGRMSAH